MSPGPPTPELPTVPLVDGLQSLYRAYQKAAIYPSGHPAVPEALRLAAAALERTLSDRPSIVVGVARDHLSLENEPLAESSGSLKSFALTLHDLDVATVELRRGIGTDELKALVSVLGTARHEGLKAELLSEKIAAAGVEHVRLAPIDYGVLSFSDGVRSSRIKEAPGDLWDLLTSQLTDTAGGGVPPEVLARQVLEVIESQEGAGVGLLRTRLRQMKKKVDGLRSKQRERTRERLAEFVAALNPGLRGDLLRLDARTPREQVALFTELADVIPEPHLLDALRQVDRIGATMPTQFATLMTKLIDLSGERTSLAPGVAATLEKWGIDRAVVEGSPTELREALQEVFHGRIEVDCNPEEDQSLLEGLSQHRLDGTAQPLELRYRDPRSPTDVGMHAAEVAVLCLGGGGGDTERPGLFGFIETATDTLIRHERFETIRDAAIAARTYSLLEDQPESAQKAAEGYLRSFDSGERAEAILRYGCGEDSVSEAAVTLLSLGGASALDRVLSRLDRSPDSKTIDALRQVAARHPPEELEHILRSRIERGWSGLRPVFPILRLMESTKAVPLLERLLAHDEAAVRTEALIGLCDRDRRPGAAEHHLRCTLADEEPRLVALAAKRLTELGTDRSREVLVEYLGGKIPGARPVPELGAGILDALLRNEQGVDRLCYLLGSMRGSFRPRTVRLAAIIAAKLSRYRGEPGVARALRHWKTSPAGIVARFLPRTRAGEGGP
jgi:hypothetical protein